MMQQMERGYAYAGRSERYVYDVRHRVARPKGQRTEMTARERGQILLLMFAAGMICLGLIVAVAYGAAVNYANNQLRDSNVALESEVDMLEIRIQSANNVAKIQSAAQEELGMEYPTGDQLVILSELKEPVSLGSLLKTTGSR